MKFLIFIAFVLGSLSASAEPKFLEMSPPKAKAHQKKQVERLHPLRMFKFKGYIGENSEGYLSIRELTGVAKAEQEKIKKMVADENKDRAAIYKEIIVFNKLNEQEKGFLIKSAFDTLRATDAKGTYHYENEKWQRKY